MATVPIKKGNLVKKAPDHGLFSIIYPDRDRFFCLDSNGKLTYFENDSSNKAKGKFLMILKYSVYAVPVKLWSCTVTAMLRISPSITLFWLISNKCRALTVLLLSSYWLSMDDFCELI